MERNEVYTFIAILRGINVSGKTMIKMPTLVQTFESLGFKNVKTYVQSGNVTFQSQLEDVSDLEKQIQDKLESDFGTKIPAIILDGKYITEVQENNPFVKESDTDLSKLHVTFLSEEPESINIAKIDADKYFPDEFIIDKKVIYLYCPAGYGKTKLHNNFFENKLKVIATTRNWNTLNALVKMVGE